MKAGFLFAGIGGFELGAEAAGLELVWSNEIDPYCCNVLRKNFSHEIIEKSILDIVDNGCKELRPVDIICGGFPCQPFSHAGKRKGTGDDRYLWPAMLECIRRIKPKYVIGENVAGIVTMDGGKVFKEILTSLEVSGYEVESFIVPAISLGAPHRRDRVWIVAYASGSGTGIQDRQQEPSRQGREASDEIGSKMVRPGNREGDAEGVKSCGGSTSKVEGFDSAHTTGERLEGATGSGVQGHFSRSSKRYRELVRTSGIWNEHWAEVAARICGAFNGFSVWMDRNKRIDIYAKTTQKIKGQDMPYLWEKIQQETFQREAGVRNKVFIKEYLFAILWKHFSKSYRQDNLLFESEEVQRAFLRNVWIGTKSGCPSQGWRHNEQYNGEYSDSMSQLSHEIALEAMEEIKEYNRNRNHRLKALGNAVVPQVAYEIIKAVITHDRNQGRTR